MVLVEEVALALRLVVPVVLEIPHRRPQLKDTAADLGELVVHSVVEVGVALVV